MQLPEFDERTWPRYCGHSHLLLCSPSQPMPNDRATMGHRWVHAGARHAVPSSMANKPLWECADCGHRWVGEGTHQ